jgi:large subunit ribosomal protein L21
MYAVIKIGGKQYRVEQGQKLLVDRQPHAAGEAFTPEVLMTGGDEVVTDRDKLAGTVSVQVVEHLRGKKIRVFAFKPKRGYKRTRGHRSELTRISVESIGGARPKRAPARKAADEPETKAAAEDKPRPRTRTAAKPRAAAKPKPAAADKADAPKPRRTRAKKEETGDGA